MTRVLLTGATGFIGRHVLPSLIAGGNEVHAVTSRPLPSAASGVVWHRANLLNATERVALLHAVRPTHLLHLAWFVAPGAFWASSENLRWVGASLDLLRVFAEQGGRRAVMAGTCAEYSWSESDLVEDATPLVPLTLYGVAKDAVRRVGERFSAQVGIEFAWGRIFFVYGPYEPESRLVPSVTTALLQGEVAHCTSGAALRDYLYVADAGAAFGAVLHGATQGAINIGSGEAVSVRSIVTALGVDSGRPDLIALGSLPDRPDDPPRICAGTQRLRREVGWVPQVTLQDGLRSTVEWWRARMR